MDLDALEAHGNLIAPPALPRFPVTLYDGRIPGDPFPARRPKFDSRSRRSYEDPKYRDAKEALAGELLIGRVGLEVRRPSEALIQVTVGFYRRTRNTVDVDNLLKTLFDAANGVLWLDDSQVREVRARLALGTGASACTRLTVKAAS
jgi:Holliday junction resolvase RusA-like endonuclease